MLENCCKFVKTQNVMLNINILCFVTENNHDLPQEFVIPASYGLHLVTQGTGILHSAQGIFPLKQGDLFFTFSSKPYYIENTDHLQYIYISFIGLRASGLFERLHISYTAPVYPGFGFLKERWISDFENANEDNIDLICEGLLLHTLSFLCKNSEESLQEEKINNILQVKYYVDLHYTQPDVDLKSVSDRFNYNYKYLSAAFLRLVKLSFSEYLLQLRMNHALRLLKGGLTNIQEIAQASGFSDAQYFSKVFKKQHQISPKNYIQQLKNGN